MPRRGATSGEHQTPIRYLAPGSGKTSTGYLWVSKVPGPQGGVHYHWEASRGHQTPKKIIPANFTGTIQSDGYQAYRAYQKIHPGDLKLAACWAHARRKFYEASQGRDSPTRSNWILRQIAHLYRTEEKLRTTRAGPALRQAIRASQSRLIINRLHRTLVALVKSGAHLPQSLLGKALSYTLGQWPGLQLFLENGQQEIDTGCG